MAEPLQYQAPHRSAVLLQWSGIALVATVWASALLFGLYILAFYAAALYGGDMVRWNNNLPGLYNADKQLAALGIGVHFAAGGIILILGSVQLLKKVRTNYPRFHIWVGRIYIAASVLAAIGGLISIAIKGTIGGTVMDIGFAMYGILMLVSAIETFRYAVKREIEIHRKWALRLFALAIGSWLYRMDYGFWFMLTDGLGHAENFNGPFDRIMAFFFYIPNLMVVELFIRSKKMKFSSLVNAGTSIIIILATGFLLLGTYYFTTMYWGPAIISWVTG